MCERKTAVDPNRANMPPPTPLTSGYRYESGLKLPPAQLSPPWIFSAGCVSPLCPTAAPVWGPGALCIVLLKIPITNTRTPVGCVEWEVELPPRRVCCVGLLSHCCVVPLLTPLTLTGSYYRSGERHGCVLGVLFHVFLGRSRDRCTGAAVRSCCLHAVPCRLLRG